MITKEKIARINELAAKAKTPEGLTGEEELERELLRKEYVDSVKSNVRERLKNVRFIEDLTPEERAAYEREKNNGK